MVDRVNVISVFYLPPTLLQHYWSELFNLRQPSGRLFGPLPLPIFFMTRIVDLNLALDLLAGFLNKLLPIFQVFFNDLFLLVFRSHVLFYAIIIDIPTFNSLMITTLLHTFLLHRIPQWKFSTFRDRIDGRSKVANILMNSFDLITVSLDVSLKMQNLSLTVLFLIEASTSTGVQQIHDVLVDLQQLDQTLRLVVLSSQRQTVGRQRMISS